MLTAACFWFWPAAGPFATYGYEPNAVQGRYLEHFHALRDGARTLVTWRHAEGLITFPSFHTTWALLLATAFVHRRRIFIASAILNGAVIISTMTTGWHYFADVLGGVAVYVIVMLAAWAARRWWIAVPASDGLSAGRVRGGSRVRTNAD